MMQFLKNRIYLGGVLALVLLLVSSCATMGSMMKEVNTVAYESKSTYMPNKTDRKFRVELVRMPTFGSPTLRMRVCRYDSEPHEDYEYILFAQMKETPLTYTALEVSINDHTVRTTTTGNAYIDLDLSKYVDEREGGDIEIDVLLPNDVDFHLDSQKWTKPYFVVDASATGVIYAEKKTSSTKLRSFHGGDCFELVNPDSRGSWINVLVRDGRDTTPGWILASAGDIHRLAKDPTKGL